jgi:hypothetical protein
MSVSQTLSVSEVSYNNSANTSQVRIQWLSTQTGESWNGYTRTAKYYVSINGGTETEYSVDYTLPQNSTKIIVDTTITVNHKADGSGTVSVRTWMDTSISAGVVQKSQTLTLTTIPRASSITSALNRALGETCYVTWSPLSSNFTYKLNFSIGSWSHTTGVIKPNTTASYTYTGYNLSLDAANQLPEATTGTMKVILATYSDNDGKVQVGSDASTTFTITVPNNEKTQPTVGMSLTPYSTLKPPYDKLYIQGLSKVKATLDFGTKYGASIVESNITVNGKSYPDTYESDILSQAGWVSVKATVKDSRGYYGTNYKEIDVIPYARPYVQAYSGETSIIAARCDSSASFSDSGTYLKIKAKAVFSKVISNGVQNNYGNIKFRYRKEGGAYSDWQTILNGKTDNSDEVITPPLLNGALDIQSNYQVQIIVSDDFYDSAPVTIAIPSDAVYMDRPAGGKSMGLGGYSTGDGKLDVYWKTMARGGLSLFDSKGDEIPLGSTMPLPRGQVAEGWNPNTLDNGTYVVTSSKPLKSGETVIMYNGILIQLNGTVDGSVKFQVALTSDENKNPFYRAYWYGNWGNWRAMKL